MRKKIIFLSFYNLLLFVSIFGGESMDILFDKSFYYPNDSINLRLLNLPNETKKIKIVITKDIQTINELSMNISKAGEIMQISLKAPSKVGGYGLDFYVNDNLILSRGLSVLNSWTESPRYGFLTDFGEGRFNAEKTMDYLAQYHINSLQYYDWMYDYGYLVAKKENYKDAWNRERNISNSVLKELIREGHENNIFSMAYVPIYGVERNLGLDHPEWLLYEIKGENYEPVDFYQKILITNTYQDSGWTKFLIQQCKETLNFGFDGIHLDQYGYPKDYASFYLEDNEYKPYITSKGFKEFINELKQQTEAPVIFNYVNNWPKEIQSQTKADMIYIEPWESCNTYEDMYKMIKEAKERSKKDVITAAYINPSFEENITLTDAVIAISGGRRLELGEYMLILGGPYFPGDEDIVSQDLLNKLRNYYDYQVRYEELFDILEKEVELKGNNLSLNPKKDSIWYNVKMNSKYVFINLVNFVGISTDFWRMKTKKPNTINDIEIFIPLNNIKNVYFASADNQLFFSKIDFSVTENGLIVKVPTIEYWSTILMELE